MRTGLLLLVLAATTGCVGNEGWGGLIPDSVGVGASRTDYDLLGIGGSFGGDRFINDDGRANTIGVWASWNLKSGRRHNDLLARVDGLQAALLAQATKPMIDPGSMAWVESVVRSAVQQAPADAGTTVVIENRQIQHGEMAQEQKQEQEQEQIEDRVIGGLKDAGEVLNEWTWTTWIMLVGLLAVGCTGAVILLRVWRRRRARSPTDSAS